MGDRANVKVFDSGDTEISPIYFYTHWNGYNLPSILADALKRGENRWDDEPYLNRIIFSEMVKYGILEETGFGVSCNLRDGDERILEVDHGKKTVSVDGQSWTFSEFIADRPDWPE